LKYKTTGILLTGLLVAGCASTSEPGLPTTSESTSLPTSSDGLKPLSSEEINTTFTGASFEEVSGSWTWTFSENGLAESSKRW